MNNKAQGGKGFDTAAAVTRSLLGWGVVAGGFYLAVGITLALTREGFELGKHQLSLLMLGDNGWMQTTNLILSGLMVIAAACGFTRAMRGTGPAALAGTLIGAYGICLVASGIFPPDPMAGFPGDATSNEASVSGLLHLTFGAVGFVVLATAAVVVATWFVRRHATGLAWSSRIAAAVVVVGFAGGAALAAETAGVAMLWVAVVTGWVWLAVASVYAYRTVPHPDAHRRTAGD